MKKSLALLPAFSPFVLQAQRLARSITPHLKLSLNVYSFNKPLRAGEIDLFDVLDFCAEHNFDAIDPTAYYFPDYPKVPTDAYLFRFKREAFLKGLDISGTGVRNNFVQPDPKKRQESIELVLHWIRAAAKMGIPNVRIFTGRPDSDEYTKDQIMEWLVRDVRTCCTYGKQYGVMIALQNHNEFLKTADEVDLLFERVDSEWLGLNLDIGSYREKDPYAEIEQNIKHAITWQIKENVWIDGQQTPTDLPRLFDLIKKAGYSGYIPLETLGPGDPYEKVPKLLTKARKALG